MFEISRLREFSFLKDKIVEFEEAFSFEIPVLVGYKRYITDKVFSSTFIFKFTARLAFSLFLEYIILCNTVEWFKKFEFFNIKGFLEPAFKRNVIVYYFTG